MFCPPPSWHSLNHTRTLKLNSYLFLAFAFILCSGICVFTFYLGFPGFHIIGDTYNSIALVKDNHHPIFIATTLESLYILFGKHLYYLFLFNIVPFYLGIFLLIAGFYLRFRSYFAILLVFPTLIGNIYFQNFIEYHSFSLPMLCFLLYSLLLFLTLNQVKFAKILWIFVFVVMAFALLWRHNSIFSVFPAFFIIIYLFLRNRKLDSFMKVYVQLLILSAFASLTVAFFIPKLLQKSEAAAANHIFLHQIAGACVPNDDASCFKKEWYYPYKNFDDVKRLYEKYPLNGDPFNVPWGYDDVRPFYHKRLAGLKTQWIKAIAKYPSDFLRHEMRFFKAMWFANPQWIFDSTQIQAKPDNSWHIAITESFAENERSIVFTPQRKKIYDFLYEHKIVLNHIVGVAVSFLTMVLCGVGLTLNRFKQNRAMLVFGFACGFAGFFSAVFIVAFSPVPETRYMSPILPLAIMSAVGLLAFVWECMRNVFLQRRKNANDKT